MAALLTAGCAVLAWFGVPLLHRALQARRLRRVCRKRRLVALSYDDGPGETLTAELLDLLKRFGARASFFPLGRQAALRPSLLDRAAAEGHEVGCHGQDHVDAWRSSPLSGLRDTRSGFASLAAWVQPDGLFRPAYGRLTLPTWLWLRSRGARIAWWTIDSGDTRSGGERDPERILAEAIETGGVVLMHDFDGAEARHHYVLELTEQLLQRAGKAGLQVVPLGQLLGEAG